MNMASVNDHAKVEVEPSFKSLTEISKFDLSRALNWYNLEDSAAKRKWATAWIKKHAPEFLAACNKAKDSQFGTAAALIRIRERGAILSPAHEAVINEWLNSLGQPQKESNLDPKPLIKQVSAPVIRKRDQNFESFDNSLDQAVKNGQANFILDPSKPTDAIKAYCERELQNIAAEPECYPKHMKKWFKEALEKVAKVLEIKKTRVVAAPTVRKKTPDQIVKYARFSEKDETTGLTGFKAIKVLGSKKVYVYDPKYRSLIRFQSTAAGVSFDGINLSNIDLAKSGYVTIRKPAEVLKSGMGIREIDRIYTSLKEGKMDSVRTQDRYLFLTYS